MEVAIIMMVIMCLKSEREKEKTKIKKDPDTLQTECKDQAS